MNSRLRKRSVNEIERQIRCLENCDPASADVDTLKRQVSRLMEGYACVTRRISSPYAWRARKNPPDQRFYNISELWYPPVEAVKRFGRLNRPHRPLMYIAGGHGVATLETQPEVGDTVTVIQMRFGSEDRKPHVMELGAAEMASQYRTNSSAELLENTKFGRKFIGKDIRKNLLIRSFLARELTKVVPRHEDDRFKLSVAIAELVMENDRTDGLQYPSIGSNPEEFRGGENIALVPGSADRLLKPEAVWMEEVERVVKEPRWGLQMRCVKRAQSIGADGSIEWN